MSEILPESAEVTVADEPSLDGLVTADLPEDDVQDDEGAIDADLPGEEAVS